MIAAYVEYRIAPDTRLYALWKGFRFRPGEVTSSTLRRLAARARPKVVRD